MNMPLKQIALPVRPKALARTDEQRKLPQFRMRVKALAQSCEIAIYGEISEEAGSALAFREALMDADGEPVTLFINSCGGDIFEGLAMYNEMRAYPGEITVRVVSMAGSAASIIAMGGTRIEIAPTAQMMIHQAWVGAQGNADDLEDLIPTLRQIDSSLVSIYVERTGQPREVIEPIVLSRKDTYLTAEQCVDLGFADAICAYTPRLMAKTCPRYRAKVRASAKSKFAALRLKEARRRLGRLAATH